MAFGKSRRSETSENGMAPKILDMARQFLDMESSGGIILAAAALAALILANTPAFDLYEYLMNNVHLFIGFKDTQGWSFEVENSLLLWINDGLMAIFFFLVGLEIKREIAEGELSSRDRVMLPAVAAIGGMALPAAMFWLVNQNHEHLLSGWAIPSATDIAFALGVVSLLGKRVPTQVKVLLTAIAIFDDILAILIIALFYGHGLVILPLVVAAAALLALYTLNRQNVIHPVPYIMLTIVLWIAVLKSGIHATIAGVVAAMFIPMRSQADPQISPCRDLEHALHPWIAFGVLPIFGFANAGVALSGVTMELVLGTVTVGIAAGLFFGKQLGIFAMIVLAHLLRISPRPQGVSWLQLYGVSVLCGIGFTMSLFIGGLAYQDPGMQAAVRIGVLSGSLASALLGYWILRIASQPRSS